MKKPLITRLLIVASFSILAPIFGSVLVTQSAGAVHVESVAFSVALAELWAGAYAIIVFTDDMLA